MPLPTPPRQWIARLVEQRGRTLATVFGVAWGTFGVVGLLAFGAGLEALMAERGQGIGQGIVIVWPARTTRPFAGFPEGRALTPTLEDVAAVERQVPELEAVAPEFIAYETLARGERVFRATVSGVAAVYGRLRNMRPAPGGRFLNERDVREARPVVFLGTLVARQLFGEADPVGRRVVLRGAPFTVVGVLAPKLQDSDYNGGDERRVCLPVTTYQRVFGDRFVDVFVFRARSLAELPAATRGVYETLGRRLGFDPDDRDALSVWDTTENDRIRGYAFLAMDLMTGLGGLLTLLVGAIGVGNLMFLVVRRRTAEIGVLLAVGARPRWVQAEVLLQTLLLVAAGGALGILGAAGLAALVTATPLVEQLGRPDVSPALALGTVVLLVAGVLVAGWLPARRSARLDPVRALVEGS